MEQAKISLDLLSNIMIL